MRLTLVGRPGCELCERMIEALLSRFPEVPWQIEEADVDSRADWQRRWGLKIPVLLDPAGEPVSVTELDVDAIAELLWERRR